jgi:hypothetical protein
MNWSPCSPNETLEDLVWLPRLLQKARRSQQMGSRLFDGYCYGENDAIDGQLLRFLNASDSDVCNCVNEFPDDAEAGRVLIRRSGRSPEECRKFSQGLRRQFLNFAPIEADECRMQPGIKRTALQFLYNRIMMPFFYAMFRRAEQKR